MREGGSEEKEPEWEMKYGEGKGVLDNGKRRSTGPFPVLFGYKCQISGRISLD